MTVETGHYAAEEVYVDAEFAGHRGVACIVDNRKVYFIDPVRIAEQWTPLAEQYQLAAVDGYHPLDDNNCGRYMVASQREYKLKLRKLTRIDEVSKRPREDFRIASLDYSVRLVMHENDLHGHFRVTFEILLGWKTYETIGPVFHNPEALKHVNFTP